MTAPDWLRCSKKFPHPDGDQATELLLIRDPHGTGFSTMPRCPEHPAADDIPLLSKMNRHLQCAVVPLDGAR